MKLLAVVSLVGLVAASPLLRPKRDAGGKPGMRVRMSQEAINIAVELGKAALKKYVETNLLSMNMGGKVITVPPTQFGKEYIIESIDHERVELPDIQMTLIEPNKVRIQVTGGDIKGSVKL
jgi:hypothetical protein